MRGRRMRTTGALRGSGGRTPGRLIDGAAGDRPSRIRKGKAGGRGQRPAFLTRDDLSRVARIATLRCATMRRARRTYTAYSVGCALVWADILGSRHPLDGPGRQFLPQPWLRCRAGIHGFFWHHRG
jgi:hypothetical protein